MTIHTHTHVHTYIHTCINIVYISYCFMKLYTPKRRVSSKSNKIVSEALFKCNQLLSMQPPNGNQSTLSICAASAIALMTPWHRRMDTHPDVYKCQSVCISIILYMYISVGLNVKELIYVCMYNMYVCVGVRAFVNGVCLLCNWYATHAYENASKRRKTLAPTLCRCRTIRATTQFVPSKLLWWLVVIVALS